MTHAGDPDYDPVARARRVLARGQAEPPIPTTPVNAADLAKLERALTTLRTRDREVFLAKRVDAMSYTEIASRTGQSAKQVRRCMARALYEIGAFMRDQPVRRWRWWPF